MPEIFREGIVKTGIMTITAFIVIAYTPSPATIINIPGDYPTIQQGIDASSDGDTVLVQPGTYVENINFSWHNIVLASLFLTTQDTSYISSTTIDGNQSGSVVSFGSSILDAATIAGFTIKNGSSLFGGGIYCINGSSPTIASNNIIENSAGYEEVGDGGGIFCYDSSPNILQNTISSNTVDAWQGGGGGIACINSSALISDNIISENSVNAYGGGFGGGIYYEGDCTIRYNTIIGNHAVDAGGGICGWSGTVGRNLIMDNSTLSAGAGIYYQSDAVVVNNTITGNWFGCEGCIGGGIYCGFDCYTSVIKNSIIRDNEEEELYFWDSLPLVIYNNIEGGWEGEGNIDCDPQFCDPENRDYHLHSNSCCVGAGEGGVDIGAFGVGCGLPCDDYVVGDYNGSGVFNVADVVDGYSKLKTGQPEADLICECPPESGDDWAVAMDLNNSCAFNVADIVIAVHKLQGAPIEFIPCEFCPPEGGG
jgi:hypothetical protein